MLQYKLKTTTLLQYITFLVNKVFQRYLNDAFPLRNSYESASILLVRSYYIIYMYMYFLALYSVQIFQEQPFILYIWVYAFYTSENYIHILILYSMHGDRYEAEVTNWPNYIFDCTTICFANFMYVWTFGYLSRDGYPGKTN